MKQEHIAMIDDLIATYGVTTTLLRTADVLEERASTSPRDIQRRLRQLADRLRYTANRNRNL